MVPGHSDLHVPLRWVNKDASILHVVFILFHVVFGAIIRALLIFIVSEVPQSVLEQLVLSKAVCLWRLLLVFEVLLELGNLVLANQERFSSHPPLCHVLETLLVSLILILEHIVCLGLLPVTISSVL